MPRAGWPPLCDPFRTTLLAIGERFSAAGFEIALVGGPVRDALIGRLLDRPGVDLDFTTDADPAAVTGLLTGWAESTWDVGIAYGTVGATVRGRKIEITTYRDESYQVDSRKPTVSFGSDLSADLVRRDFTINAMAVRLPTMALVDLFAARQTCPRVIRTPGLPEDSLGDDPLRMMRAARFSAELGFDVSPDLFAAILAQASRLSIVSAEASPGGAGQALLSPDPRRGLALLVDSGLAEYVIPELPLLATGGGRASPPQGCLRAHPDRARSGDVTRTCSRARQRSGSGT